MSKLITLFNRHYIGTAVEIAGITGVCGDTAYSSDTHIYYHWNGVAWIVGGKPYPVIKLANAYDFTKVDFTCDGNWHIDGLDLSPIVPAGAISVKIKLVLVDDAASSLFELRHSAGQAITKMAGITHVANVPELPIQEVPIDSDRLMDYQASNLVFTNIDIAILGWTIQECL